MRGRGLTADQKLHNAADVDGDLGLNPWTDAESKVLDPHISVVDQFKEPKYH